VSAANPCTVARIVAATIERREVALRRALRGARGPLRTRSLRVLSLVAVDGVRGVGDASRVDWLGGGAEDDEAELALLLERIRHDAPPASALLSWSLDPTRPAALRNALQTALLDADARRRGLGLAEFLAAAPVASRLAISALVGDDDPAAMAREAASLAALGLRSFKVKVGRTRLDGDLAAVAAVRGAVGPSAELRLDANGAWPSVSAASAALRALAPFAPAFVEEPLREASGIAALASPLPLALDESLRSAADLDLALARGGWSVLVLKLERVGGPLPALAMAARAARAGVAVVFTDSIDGGEGRAAARHPAAAAAPPPRGGRGGGGGGGGVG
jgi:L-alanine-DL-glutamate epimerase-like enolase superfamily enzyme